MVTLDRIQNEARTWREANFPKYTAFDQMMGMVEEMGELAHALLKFEQKIREYATDPDKPPISAIKNKFETDARDAVGDWIIFCLGLCDRYGWNLQDIIEETWEKVRLRDWVANPETGESELGEERRLYNQERQEREHEIS
jgi:NTP pyrophosphatase (non-canonical NTP hydrolase)